MILWLQNLRVIRNVTDAERLVTKIIIICQESERNGFCCKHKVSKITSRDPDLTSFQSQFEAESLLPFVWSCWAREKSITTCASEDSWGILWRNIHDDNMTWWHYYCVTMFSLMLASVELLSLVPSQSWELSRWKFKICFDWNSIILLMEEKNSFSSSEILATQMSFLLSRKSRFLSRFSFFFWCWVVQQLTLEQHLIVLVRHS